MIKWSSAANAFQWSSAKWSKCQDHLTLPAGTGAFWPSSNTCSTANLKKLFRISGDSLLANHHPRQGTFGKKQIQTWDKNMVESSFLGLNHLQHIFNYVATVSKPISNTRLKGAVLFAKLHRFHPAPPVPNDLPLPLQAAPAARSANRQKSPRTLSPTAPWLWWSWANYKQN